jgi:hypothetical protein
MITFTNNGINTSMLDYDAREFIRLAKLTDETQIRAVNELCKDLKRERFWDSFWRVFPFVYGGTTASMLYCLKTRQILTIDSTPGSLTFSSTGVQFGYTSSLSINGIFLQNTEIYYGGHISIYNRTSTNFNFSQRHGMAGNGGAQRFTGPFLNFGSGTGTMSASFYNGSVYRVPGNPYSSSNTNGDPGNPRVNTFTYSGDNTGLFLYSNRNIETGTSSLESPFIFYMSKNETILGITYSPRNSAGQANTIRIGNYYFLGTTSQQSLQEICWWSIGGGLPNSANGGPIELIRQPSFYQIVQKFQTTLGRQV